MLNITENSISQKVDMSKYKAYRKLEKRTNSKSLMRILLVLFIISILAMFLPWTQNIRSTGYVTTLNPYDKPQNIQALIGGKIDNWLVQEGDIVSIGDTIVILTEAKEEYFDPDLLDNTMMQRDAKSKSAEAFLSKRKFLSKQLSALEDNRDSKLQQLSIKQQQIDLEIASYDLELESAKVKAENAENQYARMQNMYEKGIKSLTDLESKRLSLREGQAKLLSMQNKLNKLQNDKLAIAQDVEAVNADYLQKVAKIESDIQSADSYRYTLLGEQNKLNSKMNQLSQRQNAFVITSPVNGRITKVLKNGIGEFVKAQDNIATIVPTDFQKAVELYISPVDMPLMQEGKNVRLQFDGWPAMVFSGWPNNSIGTFAGKVYAIDNDISKNGKYRILVTEDNQEKSWPDLIRIGSGVQGLLLLNEVKVYYELWRKLNGFPPDFYLDEKSKKIKSKAPLRKVK